VIPETAHPHSDPCYNALLVDLPETPDSDVYAHNVSPVPGTSQISPFFLVFGHNAPSPKVITLDLKSARELNIAEGKQVYVRRPPLSSQPKGSATRFIRRFDGPYTVMGHVHGHQDLLRL